MYFQVDCLNVVFGQNPAILPILFFCHHSIGEISGGLSAPETPAITADREFFVKISELDENLRLIFPDPEVSLKLSYHFKLNKSGGRGSCIRS